MAMQIWENCLYVGTTTGLLACFTVSLKTNLDNNLSSQLPPKNPDITLSIENEKQRKETFPKIDGIILECIRQGKLKVRPHSSSYHQD